ncbi:MAG TPA: hypothetical protein VN818_03270 [Gammaproteobacteria bacterium]|nr:hypothetical protein [Gammaproteobacteria bacterium]
MATVAGRAERARKDTPKRSAAPTNELSEEEIRLLAYRLYERRCESGTAGDAAGDWTEAEQLLSNSALAANTSGN